MIYVYKPGAAIEEYLSANSMHLGTTTGPSLLTDEEMETTPDPSLLTDEELDTTTGSSLQTDEELEAATDYLENTGSGNTASRQQAPPTSPQSTYCSGKPSKIFCVQHILKTSVLFGNALSTFSVVSTLA